MKSILKIILLLIFVLNFGFAQGDLHVNEIQIKNLYNENIRIDVYPEGLVFNGDKEYKLRCKHIRKYSIYNWSKGICNQFKWRNCAIQS